MKPAGNQRRIEMIKVKLHCYDKSAIEGTKNTLMQMGAILHVDEKNQATIHSNNDDYMKFAVINQGYVKEVL